MSAMVAICAVEGRGCGWRWPWPEDGGWQHRDHRLDDQVVVVNVAALGERARASSPPPRWWRLVLGAPSKAQRLGATRSARCTTRQWQWVTAAWWRRTWRSRTRSSSRRCTRGEGAAPEPATTQGLLMDATAATALITDYTTHNSL
jgi:hypothetical protein